MQSRTPILLLALLLGCGGAQQPQAAPDSEDAGDEAAPEGEAAPDGEAPADEAPAEAAPETVEGPVQFDDRWQSFLEGRFGHKASRHWIADFDGDGDDALIVRLPEVFLAFHETGQFPPSSWHDVYLSQAEDVAVTVEQPDLAKRRTMGRASGAHLLVGTDHPIALYLHSEIGEYAWEQVYPKELDDVLTQASGQNSGPFEVLGANRLLGPKGWEGEDPLDDWFIGDFDADGNLDVLVIVAGKLHLHRKGKPPETAPLEYPARRAIVVFNESRTLKERSGDDERDIEVKGDFLAMDVPEASSAALIRQGGSWLLIMQGD